jgi:hypothetical protein
MKHCTIKPVTNQVHVFHIIILHGISKFKR